MLKLAVLVAAVALTVAEQPGTYVREVGPTRVQLGGALPARAPRQEGNISTIISDYIVQFLEGYRDVLSTGGDIVPALDPFRIDELGPFEYNPEGLSLIRMSALLNNLEVGGISSFNIEDLFLNLRSSSFTFHITLPELLIQTDYSAQVRITLINQSATGVARIVVQGIEVDWFMQLTMEGGSLQVSDLRLVVAVDSTHVSMTEVTGVGVIDLVINWFLQNASSDVVQNTLDSFNHAVSTELLDSINELLGRWSLNDLQNEYVINEQVDGVLPQVSELVMNNNLDPMPLPDIDESFYYKPLLITYRGQLLIDQGQLTNLASLRRSGDAKVTYFANTLRFRIELGFDELELKYNYLAKLMDIGPAGGIRGTLDRFDITFDILFDFNNFELHLQDFNLDHGRLRVRLTGNFLTDWFVNAVTATFTRMFENIIIRFVEVTIRNVLVDQIERFNFLLKELLGHL